MFFVLLILSLLATGAWPAEPHPGSVRDGTGPDPPGEGVDSPVKGGAVYLSGRKPAPLKGEMRQPR